MNYLLFALLSTGLGAYAYTPQEMDQSLAALEGSFVRSGGNVKALNQLRCFVQNHSQKTFVPKPAGSEMDFRCNAKPTMNLLNSEKVAIIDYTKTSNLARLFIFDLKNRKLKPLRVAHGKYGKTDRLNDTVTYNPPQNSVLKAVHFSNKVGSNASVGGFFLTGFQYTGQWGESLILHGLETDINDNACERATVIHKSTFVTDTTVTAMSSGCPMVPVNRLNEVLSDLSEGSLLYIYTPAETKLTEKQCGRGLRALSEN